MKKEVRICPVCLRPFNSSADALNLMLDKNFPRAVIEVEDKTERIEKPEIRVQKKPIVAKKPEPEEDVEEEEYEDLRLD